MLTLVKYTARRNGNNLETISREVVGYVPGDPDKQLDDLARIFAKSLRDKLKGGGNIEKPICEPANINRSCQSY